MRVIDHRPHAWFLLDDGERLVLDINCSQGAFGFDFSMELSAEELACFRQDGRHYIDRLAAEVDYSAPGLAAGSSPYKTRWCPAETREAIAVAVATWRRSPG